MGLVTSAVASENEKEQKERDSSNKNKGGNKRSITEEYLASSDSSLVDPSNDNPDSMAPAVRSIKKKPMLSRGT